MSEIILTQEASYGNLHSNPKVSGIATILDQSHLEDRCWSMSCTRRKRSTSS